MKTLYFLLLLVGLNFPIIYPLWAVTCRDVLIANKSDLSADEQEKKRDAIRSYLAAKGFTDDANFDLLLFDSGIQVLNIKSDPALEKAAHEFMASKIGASRPADLEGSASRPAASEECTSRPAAYQNIASGSSPWPVVIELERRLKFGPQNSLGPDAHRFSDRKVPLRNRIFVDYEFQNSDRYPIPSTLRMASFSLSARTTAEMEKALIKNVLGSNYWVGAERGGGPVLICSLSGFNGELQDFFTLTAERFNLFGAEAQGIFLENRMQFHFDQFVGSEFIADKAIDVRRSRNGVDKIKIQLPTLIGAKANFRLNGFWTRAELPENDQTMAVSPRFPKPARAYRDEFVRLGFKAELIETLPAGARLVMMGKSFRPIDSQIESSLMLVAPFEWEDYFGGLALERFTNEPSSNNFYPRRRR